MNKKNIFAKRISLFYMVLLIVMLNGCASIAHNPQDPWEEWNRGTQGFNDDVDAYIMKPVAEGYDYITPEFVSTSVSNFFSNLRDIGVTINDLLQLKFTQGSMDAGRFLVNTTAGIGGLIDVAPTPGSTWSLRRDRRCHHRGLGRNPGNIPGQPGKNYNTP